MTASAGSGKTHRLAERYLDLLLAGSDDRQYRRILAVTFTNKATEEMKSRIIQNLYALSQEGDEAAKRRARARMSRLLHDYSCFSVSTIDKFFQTVMRAFAREIGQYASYRLELDAGDVLNIVVDQLIASLEEPGNEDLFHWLKEYTFDRVEQGENRDVKEPLKRVAAQFLSEAFLLLQNNPAVARDSILGDKVRLRTFIDKINGIIHDYPENAKAVGDAGVQLIRTHIARPDEYVSKKPGRSTGIFFKWAGGETEKYIPYAKEVDLAVQQFPDSTALAHLFTRATSLYQEYHTALAIRENLYLMGLYHELQKTLEGYLRENNIVLNSMTNNVLREIIAGDDAPFVYEKIGTRYEHLMLDEAQDTSRMQWDNFLPLFRNSQASGGCDLVVGDVKQSIYRWRGSDWHLMGSQIKSDLSRGPLEELPLKENWRSGEAVVTFNNDFFSRIGELLGRDKDRALQAEMAQQLYADCSQIIPEKRKGNPPGFVQVTFIDPGTSEEDGMEWRQKALERMLGDIAALRKQGYRYKDITVLVRRNWEGAMAANMLIEKGISVLTQDSLSIGSAPCISRLMALLDWQVNPDDPVCELQARSVKHALDEKLNGSLYEQCEQLLGSGQFAHEPGELPFIYAFLDAVLAYQQKYGSSVRGFVKWWDETGRKKKIAAPEGQDAVQVMTIHKAKGLSLDAVIIPFCTEKYSPGSTQIPTIWCQAKAPFAELGLIPVRATSSLKNTMFAADYEEERTLEHIDVLNNWYVAFTRARTRLLLYAPVAEPRTDDKGRPSLPKPSSIENTLFLHLYDRLKGERQYAAGTATPFSAPEEKPKEEQKAETAFKRVAMTDKRLRLSLQGDDYFSSEATARIKGIEEHKRMAEVLMDEELEARSGHRHWFDDTYLIHNEASVVTAEGEIYRPDRVLISRDGSRVIVIDYKFGQPLPSHRKQVRNYMTLLRQMGYPAVEGWLWYVTASTIERV